MISASQLEKDYMTSKDAGAILGYTHDYISRLCRLGKMVGVQKGREWFVTQTELDAFKKRHAIELREKKKVLSKKFSKIRLEAEAKKRLAREQHVLKPEHISKVDLHTEPSIKKTIKFKLPRELVALAVLALVLFAPNFLHHSQTPSKNTVVSQNNNAPLEYVDIVKQGIVDTAYAQSTLIKPVASVFAITPYLADGYWEFFKTVGELPAATYNTWYSIGDGYLLVYQSQGEIIYSSVANLATVGNSVLVGYELVGRSFVEGTQNIIEVYSKIVTTDSEKETAKKKLNQFSSDVEDGYVYAQEGINQISSDKVTNKIKSGYDFFITNVAENIYAMYFTASNLSQTLTANASSLFDFNLSKKENSIRTIQINN